MTVKLLLDTDIGSDIDDAICLAYLLAQPKCELLGITTVTGESDKRAMMVSALCKVAGKDIPILPGAGEPLVVEQKQPHTPQAAALSKWEHDTKFPKGEAIEFLRQTIRANPGEVTLLTIGPLTNIGLLFRTDPEIPALLKSLVIMGGVFTEKERINGKSEWNILCDPHAAAIVYRARVKIHRSVGLDVTMQAQMYSELVRERFSRHPLLRLVQDFADVNYKEAPYLIFHDHLTATTIFDPDICKFYPGQVEIDINSPTDHGFSHWQENAVNPTHEVALEIDVPRFFEHYFSVFEK